MLFDDIVNGIGFLILFLDYSLQVCRYTVDFYMDIWNLLEVVY